MLATRLLTRCALLMVAVAFSSISLIVKCEQLVVPMQQANEMLKFLKGDLSPDKMLFQGNINSVDDSSEQQQQQQSQFSVDEIAQMLQNIVQQTETTGDDDDDSSDYDDADLGSLSELLMIYNEQFNYENSCSMDKQKSFIRLLVHYYRTPIGPFIDDIREKQRHYCWTTFNVRLSEQAAKMDEQTKEALEAFAEASELPAQFHIFSLDNIADHLVNNALRRYASQESNNMRLRDICQLALKDYKLEQFLWLLKVIERPKSLATEQQSLLLGAKLCLSFLEANKPKVIQVSKGWFTSKLKI